MTIRTLVHLLLLPFLLWAGTTGPARADDALEYKVKAAFLLNFAKFTTWPSSAWAGNDAEFLLSVLGGNPFGPALQDMEQKTINGRRIRLQPVDSTDGCERCHLLFVSRSEEGRLELILRAMGRRPVVTVSDIEGFAAAGGIFEFRNKDGRLSFIINNSKARENGIQISASLLNLAIEVL